MFRPMAITVCSALLGSLLLSLTAVPVVSSYLLRCRARITTSAGSCGCATRYRATWRGPSPTPGARWRCARGRRGRGDRLAAVPRHRVHAPARRGLDPDRDAQAAVGVARRVGGDVARGSSRSSGLSRGARRWSPRWAGPTWPPRPWASTRATSTCGLHPIDEWTTGRDKEALIEALATSLAAMPGRDLQLHAADGDAARRSGLGREGRRGGEDLRPGRRRPSSGSARRWSGRSPTCAAPATCRPRCSLAPPRCRSPSTARRSRATA